MAFISKLYLITSYRLKVHFDQKHPIFLCLKYEDWWSPVTYQVLFSEAMDRFSNIEPFLLAKGVLWPLVPNNYILLSTPPHWIWTTCWILHWKVPKCKCTNHKLFLSFTGIQTNCLRKINQFGHGGGQKTQIYNLGYHR